MQTGCDVSVVIPCYNAAGVVRRAVASAIHQTCPPQEVIVVDDASRDDTRRVLRQLSEESGGVVRVVTLAQNSGAAAARNAGWGAARGACIAFLDADDEWLPDKLQIHAAWMKAHPDCLFSGHALAGRGAGPCAWRWVGLRSVIFSNPFRPSSVMIRRDAPARFDERKRYSEDYDLWLRLLADGARGAILDAPLTRVSGTQWLAQGLSKDLWRMERAELDNFRALLLRRNIGGAAWLIASAWSIIKFCRRWALRHLAA